MIVVDGEYSGLDPYKHAILSIGAVDFLNPENRFYGECRVFEGAEIDDGALLVNGFTKEQALDPKAKSLEEMMKEFLAWVAPIEDRTIAGQNVYLDRDMLDMAARRCKIPWLGGKRIVDLHAVCYASHLKKGQALQLEDKLSPLSLDLILKYVGVPEEPKPHNALTGALLETEAFGRLIYGRAWLPEYEKHALPDYLLA